MSVLPQAVTAGSISGSDPLDFFLRPEAAGGNSNQEVPEVDLATAERLILEGALPVDARDPDEFRAGHIKGSLNCPASDIGRWRLHLAGIAKTQKIIVYCASANCGKGHYVASVLLQNGFSEVWLYPPGWSKWPGPKEFGN